MVVSSLAFDFLRTRGGELFPATPIVFASVNAAAIDRRTLPPHITGVAVTRDYRDTLNLALAIHPDTERVFYPPGRRPPSVRGLPTRAGNSRRTEAALPSRSSPICRWTRSYAAWQTCRRIR